ncbi:NADH dehydrogenase-like [Scleropages formosus]|uniref:NADH dehydrogenase [ubiquinone] 1 beta subcomplex subunit 1 n=1 Tax=Scleropages formosus TaxID=113540 RepID=A0A0P7WJW4_SCLFO|nr:NADH dehydrogenase-like [Scleropages formosus]
MKAVNEDDRHSGNMVNVASVLRNHWVNVLVPLGFVIGVYLDRKNDEKLTAFRNKSKLYSSLWTVGGNPHECREVILTDSTGFKSSCMAKGL